MTGGDMAPPPFTNTILFSLIFSLNELLMSVFPYFFLLATMDYVNSYCSHSYSIHVYTKKACEVIKCRRISATKLK